MVHPLQGLRAARQLFKLRGYSFLHTRCAAPNPHAVLSCEAARAVKFTQRLCSSSSLPGSSQHPSSRIMSTIERSTWQ